MNKIKTILLTLLCVISMITPMTVDAYHFWGEYESEASTIYARDYDPECDINVSVYMLVDTTYSKINNNWGVMEFQLYDGPAQEHYEEVLTIGAKIDPLNKVVYETFEDYEIWVFDFDLEDGMYKFPGHKINRRNLPDIEILSSTCEIETYDKGSTPEENLKNALAADFEFMMLDNTDLRLYAYYGWGFSDETIDAFCQWCKEKESKFLEEEEKQGGHRGIRDVIMGNPVVWYIQKDYSRIGFPEGVTNYEEYLEWAYAQTTTNEPEITTPSTEESTTEAPVIEETKEEPKVEDEVTPSVDTSVTIEDTITQLPEETEDEDTKETKSNPIVGVIGGVVAIVGLLLFVGKKKK